MEKVKKVENLKIKIGIVKFVIIMLREVIYIRNIYQPINIKKSFINRKSGKGGKRWKSGKSGKIG